MRAKTGFNFFIFIDENKSLIKRNIFIKTWWLGCSIPPLDTPPALYLTWHNTLITLNPYIMITQFRTYADAITLVYIDPG
jgi:hypothetical protein